MRYKDLTGQRFFWLTVIRKFDDPNSKEVKWLCKCDCGNEVVVTAANLKSGNTKSCGCYYRSERLRANIIGKQFGFLTAIKRINSKDVLCKCLCGNEIVVSYSNLTSGNTRSCGCALVRFILNDKLTNLTGRIFGELLVIARYGDMKGNRNPKWLCRCSCGRYTIVDGEKLKSGHTQSCGCMKNSLPESIIVNYLRSHNVSYEKEYKFKDLRSEKGYPLRFDFKINTENSFFLLEYQGQQHYLNHDDFGKQQREVTDKQKKDYCMKNNIELIEIKYDEEIVSVLEKILIEHCILHDNPVPSSDQEKV